MIKNTNKSEFLQTMTAVINYFDPNSEQSEADRKLLEIANETVKIEIDRLKKAINEIKAQISGLETNNTILSGNLAFTVQEIYILEKDNLEKLKRIDELKQVIEERKKYLVEAQGELDTHRRNEAFLNIAEKRTNKEKNVWEFSFRSDLLKEKCEKKEDKLEKALFRLQKLNENIKHTKEQILHAQFRLGIEMKDHAMSQSKLLPAVSEVDKRVPSRRPTTAIFRTKIFTK